MAASILAPLSNNSITISEKFPAHAAWSGVIPYDCTVRALKREKKIRHSERIREIER